MKKVPLFVSAVLAGMCIGFGGLAFLSVENRVIGAALFTIGLFSLFFLGLLCNIFIYIAVEGYRSNPHELGKYLSLFLGVMVFILCGTEHCVADMFYFWMANVWSLRTVACLLVISLGNAAGGVLIPLLRSLAAKH